MTRTTILMDGVEVPIEITVTRCEEPKCPRCWRHCGIPTNFEGCCDRCMEALRELGYMPREVREADLRQIFRWRRDLKFLPEETKQRLIEEALKKEFPNG